VLAIGVNDHEDPQPGAEPEKYETILVG